jgi:hypothetical protein
VKGDFKIEIAVDMSNWETSRRMRLGNICRPPKFKLLLDRI